MSFSLPKAPFKYNQTDQNQTRSLLALAIEDMLARLGVLEASEGTVTPPPAPNPPLAGFSYATHYRAVQFQDQSTDIVPGTVVAWLWDFGDGVTSTTKHPSHIYSIPGSFTVQLTVTDNDNNTAVLSQNITVTEHPAAVPGNVIGAAPNNGTLIPPSAAPNGATLTLGANRTTVFTAADTVAAGSRFYAGLGTDTITFRGGQNFQITHLGQANDCSWQGGYSLGGGPAPLRAIDGSVSWADPGWHAQAALSISKGLRWVVEKFRSRYSGDAITTNGVFSSDVGGLDGSVFRYNVLEDAHDDCFENDWKSELTLFRNFMSGASGISSRPGQCTDYDLVDTSSKSMTLDGNLLWLKGQSYSDLAPQGGSVGQPCVFFFHKWQSNYGGACPTQGAGAGARALTARIKNNVYRYDETPQSNNNSGGIWGTSFPASKIIEQSNNVVCFTARASGLPTGWPTSGLTGYSYLYGDAAKRKWNAAVLWLQDINPSVPIQDPGLFVFA